MIRKYLVELEIEDNETSSIQEICDAIRKGYEYEHTTGELTHGVLRTHIVNIKVLEYLPNTVQ